MYLAIAAALGLTSTSYPGHLHTDAYDSHYYRAHHPTTHPAAAATQHGYGGYGGAAYGGQHQQHAQYGQQHQQHSDPYYGGAAGAGDYYDQVRAGSLPSPPRVPVMKLGNNAYRYVKKVRG